MRSTVVDRVYKEFSSITEFLDANQELSFKITLDEYFRKNLLLCAASHFEYIITTEIQKYVAEVSGRNTLIPMFVKNKAISRQFHTLFDWEKSNANKFFGLFGPDLSSYAEAHLQANPQMKSSIKAFLELGSERNRLIHQDFGSLPLEKTADEIYILYKNACDFVYFLPTLLRDSGKSTD